jgi:HlyD family secretion protein
MNYEPGSMGEERLALADGGMGARRSRRRWIVGAGLAILVLLLAWWAYGSHGKKEAAPAGGGAQQAPTVTVATPGRQVVDRMISATGSLAAKRDMPVGVAGEGGQITRVLVEPGQWVRAGQVLATVDRSVQQQTAASLAAQINVARSDLNIAASELARANSLVDRGFISKADLQRKAATRDAAAARVRVAQAQLAETQARNGRLDIRAPAAGLILTRAAEPGQVVSAGTGMLFRIAMGGEMEMRAALSESDLTAVHQGMSAEVTPVGSAEHFTGRVWQIAPVIDAQSRQGVVRIQLAYNPALRPGGFAAASIRAGGADAPLLPESAVQSDAKGNYVYVIDGKSQAIRRDIKTGDVSDAGVVVTSGLNGTERVVLSAGAFLTPGQKVLPQPIVLKR